MHERDRLTDGETDTGPQQRRAYAYRRAVKKTFDFGADPVYDPDPGIFDGIYRCQRF